MTPYLLLYLLVFVGTLIIGRLVVRRADRTDTLTPLPLPARLDPYQVVCLRTGQIEEMARLAVLDLVSSGHLSVARQESRFWRLVPKTILSEARGERDLPWYLSTVLSWFTTPQKAEEMYNDDPRLGDLSRLCLEMEERLRKDTLLAVKNVTSTGVKAWLISVVVMVALAVPMLPELLRMWSRLLIPVPVMLLVIAFVCNPNRLTKRGKAYLARLQVTYRVVPASTLSLASTTSDINRSLLVAFALFGIEGVKGTRYEFLRQMFQSRDP